MSADASPPVLARFSPDSILPVPVLVVEDEPLIQRRLSEVLGRLGYTPEVVYLVGTLGDARRLVAEQPMALALVDLGLPDGNGIELIAELRAADPGMGILVISAWSTEDAILAALRAGATGYVLKERDDLEVTLSIRSVLRGGAPIDPFIARRLIAEMRTEPHAESHATPGPGAAPDAGAIANVAGTGAPAGPARAAGPAGGEAVISARESEILALVANGLSNREIAETLFISRYTVESHVKHIYRKLAVSSRIRAVSEARSRGLLD